VVTACLTDKPKAGEDDGGGGPGYLGGGNEVKSNWDDAFIDDRMQTSQTQPFCLDYVP
jgi:hypothetical protein